MFLLPDVPDAQEKGMKRSDILLININISYTGSSRFAGVKKHLYFGT